MDIDSIKGKKALIVEDNQLNILIARKLLSEWGLKMDIATDGKIGIGKAKKFHYDIILMDLQMPNINGYDAARAIRNFNKNVPILAMTASNLQQVKTEVKKAKMNDLITKPLTSSELKVKLLQHIVIDKDNVNN